MVWKPQFGTKLHEGGLVWSTQILARAASQTLLAAARMAAASYWVTNRIQAMATANLEAQTFPHWPCLHFVSLSSNHFGSFKLFTVEMLTSNTT